MIYSIEYLVKILKAAREKKGLSQRALSQKVRIPQSHISKIENGEVDLQASSLVELARTLELELVLIPRQLIPMIKSLQRNSEPRIYAPDQKALEYMVKHLEKMRKQTTKLAKQFPHLEALAKLADTIKELQYVQLNPAHISRINKIIKQLETLLVRDQLEEDLLQIKQLTRYLINIYQAHMHDKQKEPVPMYQLDEEDDD